MRLYICSGRQFEETFENPLWRKVLQVQPLRLCICWVSDFEGTLENSLWYKTTQMQPLWICICSGRPSEAAFEISFRGKIIPMQPVQLCIYSGRHFKETFKNSLWREIEKCSNCDYAFVYESNLRAHKCLLWTNHINATLKSVLTGKIKKYMKTHSREKLYVYKYSQFYFRHLIHEITNYKHWR